jgi:hypothetical protein
MAKISPKKESDNLDLGPHFDEAVRIFGTGNSTEEKQPEIQAHEDEDSIAATTQPIEDLPQTFEELLQGITVDELTKRLQITGYVNDANVWIGRGNQIPVLWDIMRKKALIKTSTPVLAFGQAVREHYKGGRGTSDGTLKAQPDYISFTQKQAKQAFLDIL